MVAWPRASLIASVAITTSNAAIAQSPPFPCPEPQWLPGDGVPGVWGGVRALHNWDPDGPGPLKPVLAVGGEFEVVGRTFANSIATLDPDTREWSALGAGIKAPSIGWGVHAITSLASGELIVGGEFTTAGGVSANSVARWDGVQWHAMGQGLSWYSGEPGTVRALLVLPNGDVIAGGYFSDSSGNEDVWFIGRWDGENWKQFEDPAAPTLNGPIHALAIAPDGSLIAGGLFTATGGEPLNFIARWDGAAWQPLGTGLEGGLWLPGVNAVAVTSAGDLVAAGDFTIANGAPVNNIALWNGTGWSNMAGGLGTQIGELCESLLTLPNGDLLAGGTFATAGGVTASGLARWTGFEWSPEGHDFGNEVQALSTLNDGTVLVGGAFGYSFDGPMPSIAQLPPNTDQWKPIGTGLGTDSFWSSGSVNAVVSDASGDAIVGGDFVAVGTNTNIRAIARWDGTPGGWHPLGAGLRHAWSPESAYVSDIVTLPTGDLVATGYFTHSGDIEVGNIARWDGTVWHAMGGGSGGNSIECLTVQPTGDLFAGGWFKSVGGIDANRVARWDGSMWWPLGVGVGDKVNDSVFALTATNGGDVIAGGIFATAGGQRALNVARWDGTNWHSMGSGLSGGTSPRVRRLVSLPNDDVIAGGQFKSSGGTTLSALARWDGTAWHALGTSPAFTDVIGLFALPNGDILAGGIDYVFPQPSKEWAGRWDGTQWHDLGFGPDSYVHGFALTPSGDLIAGGSFLSAGPHVSAHVARLACPPSPCYPDCDHSGSLDIDDFICFQTLYALNNSAADCDQSGSLDIDDFICFQTAYALGC